jgi:hypothetical protein
VSRTIYKYKFEIKDDYFDLMLPQGAEIISLGIQRLTPVMWAIIDDEAPQEMVRFRVAGTGHDLTEDCTKETYIGRIEQMGLQWHIFKVKVDRG